MKGKGAEFVRRNARRGQVSAEMILIIAAVLAVALVLASKMQETAKRGADAIDKGADKLFSEINDTAGIGTTPAKRASGAACTRDSQCASGSCDDILKTCA